MKYTDEQLKAMDNAIHQKRDKNPHHLAKYAAVKAELQDIIIANTDLTRDQLNNCLYYLSLLIQRIEQDKQNAAKNSIMRGHANMQNAANNLKNWR